MVNLSTHGILFGKVSNNHRTSLEYNGSAKRVVKGSSLLTTTIGNLFKIMSIDDLIQEFHETCENEINASIRMLVKVLKKSWNK